MISDRLVLILNQYKLFKATTVYKLISEWIMLCPMPRNRILYTHIVNVYVYALKLYEYFTVIKLLF